MPEPVSASILIGIASGLATDAISWAADKAKDSDLGQGILAKSGNQSVHPKLEKAFKLAIRRASNFPQLDGNTLQNFIDTTGNRRVLSRCIWDPKFAELRKKDLDYSSAVRRTDTSNLKRFITQFAEEIKIATREVLDDEASYVIEQVRKAVGEEGKTTRDVVRTEHEETRSAVNEILEAVQENPAQQDEWEELQKHTRRELNRVSYQIGGAVELPRQEECAQILDAFAEEKVVALIGASGSGKTCIARNISISKQAEGRVIWANPSDLESNSLTEWENKRGLSFSLEKLISEDPVSDGLLVLDGLDQLYNETDFATVAEFIRVVSSGSWHIIMTCQPEAWDRVCTGLIQQGSFPTHLEQVSIGQPDSKELEKVWGEFPSLQSLRTRLHLSPILFRPKVLDLLASRTQLNLNLSSVGESDLASWFWETWVEDSTQGLLQTSVATELAILLGDELRSGISLSKLQKEFDSGEIQQIEKLISNRVLSKRGRKVEFEHDLYGDWGRLRHLIDVHGERHLTDFLSDRVDSPVWHRAIRLLGLHFFEREEGAKAWSAAFRQFDPSNEDGELCQDLFLESAAFITRPSDALENIWPLLADEDGQLLRRFLTRLLHSATIPDPRIREAIASEDPSLEPFAAATRRIPYWPYWYSILSLLHEKREQIPSSAHTKVARTVDLWLRYTQEDWLFRKEAADIAVQLGTELLRDKEKHGFLYRSSERGKAIYRAVLASGIERPGETVQIILEAAGRREQRFGPLPLSEEEIEKLNQNQSQSPLPSINLSRGPLLPPWKHGPMFRVDSALQDIVLKTDALIPFIQSHPHHASEILLALLINEPEYASSFYRSESRINDLKLQYRSDWYPAFYHHGPFRAFLNISEDQGINTILRLVGHATERWADHWVQQAVESSLHTDDDILTPYIDLLLDGETTRFLGNKQIIRWNLQGGIGSNAVQSALMALEKHIYDEIEAERDIEPIVKKILKESRSVPLLGLLVSIGRRNPALFQGLLLPLLGSPEILRSYLPPHDTAGWRISIRSLPAHLQQGYADWHQMRHRNLSLLDIAQFLFVHNTDVRSFLEDNRHHWEEEVKPGGKHEGSGFVENLIELFDWGNYTPTTDENGDRIYLYEPSEELQKRAAESAKASEITALALGTPTKCKSLLDGNETIDEETLLGLWSRVQRLEGEDLPDEGDPLISTENVHCGVAAVMICRGRGWLRSNRKVEEWALSTILQAGKATNLDANPYSSLPIPQEQISFIAEAVPVLWEENPEDSEVRDIVTKFILNADSSVVQRLVESACPRRNQLGEDYLRLLRLVQKRSRLVEQQREAERQSRGPLTEENTDRQEEAKSQLDNLSNERDSLRQSFLNGTLKPELLRIRDLLPPIELREHQSSRSGRKYPTRRLDDGLLTASFIGMPIEPDTDNTDFPNWRKVWVHALQDTVGPLTPEDDKMKFDLDGPPDSWDRFILGKAANLLANSGSANDAREIWEPIINLGPAGSSWTSWFLNQEWANLALSETRDSLIETIWRDMISYALDHPRWSASPPHRYFERGKLWRQLFGFGYLSNDVWHDGLRSFAQSLNPLLETWARNHLHRSRNAGSFAAFLQMPAADAVLIDGITWIDQTADEAGERFWDNDADDQIASLLVHAWMNAKERIERNDQSLSAFRTLLQKLVSRQNPLALELSDRVGGSSLP